MIGVTGASGTVGSEVVRQLRAAEIAFRAVYRASADVEAARARGIDAIAADYRRPETLRAAFEGCDAVFLLGANAVDQTRLELNAVDAATAVGVRHIVKQSVMGAEAEDFSLARVHRPVERAIEASGATWTFLRANSFMQNVVTYMAPPIRSEGVFFSASGPARISHVDVRDLAAVAVHALTRRGHEGRAYTLTGPEALTYDEIASELSRAIGRPIAHIDLPPSDLRNGLLAQGLGEQLADRMLDLERYFREDRASRISDDVREVTGHEPGRFAAYAIDCATALQAA